MSGVWGLAAMAVGLILAVARDLISLRRDRLRRESLERILAGAASGTRIVDRDRAGAVVTVVVGNPTREADPPEPGGPAA